MGFNRSIAPNPSTTNLIPDVLQVGLRMFQSLNRAQSLYNQMTPTQTYGIREKFQSLNRAQSLYNTPTIARPHKAIGSFNRSIAPNPSTTSGPRLLEMKPAYCFNRSIAPNPSTTTTLA